MLKGLTKTLSIAAALAAGIGVLGGAAMFLTTSMPTASIAADKTISGKVIYRERIALPPEARLIVQLNDISLADAPSKIIGETQVDALRARQSPSQLILIRMGLNPNTPMLCRRASSPAIRSGL